MSRSARLPNPLHVTQAECDRAKRWAIGQAVTVTKDDGSIVATQTRSAPWKTGNGTWVLLVEGISGYYALARVRER